MSVHAQGCVVLVDIALDTCSDVCCWMLHWLYMLGYTLLDVVLNAHGQTYVRLLNVLDVCGQMYVVCPAAWA